MDVGLMGPYVCLMMVDEMIFPEMELRRLGEGN